MADPPDPLRHEEARLGRGGNVYSGGGGIYFSKDGGQTWSLDVDSGAEMDACDGWWHNPVKFQVWCAGYDGSLTGRIYTLTRTVLPEQVGGDE